MEVYFYAVFVYNCKHKYRIFYYRAYQIAGFKMALIILSMNYLCSLHGLIRGENMELGRDSDTGGQVKVTNNCFHFNTSIDVVFHPINIYSDAHPRNICYSPSQREV